MAVTLHIVEPSYGEVLTKPFVVPDGSIITVRRHAQGADIAVVPQVGAVTSEGENDPSNDGERYRLIAVSSFTVERTRPGCAELAIVDGDGALWRLYLGGDMGRDLGACLSSGAPISSRDSHEAALARRANAEAELAELEVAEKTRAARANNRDVQAGRLSLDTDEDAGTVTLCVGEIGGGPELKTGLRRDQLLWLAQQLLAAYGRLDRKGR